MGGHDLIFSSIQGVELERLMVLFILASNVFLIGVIFSGFIADSKNQIKAFGILRLLPGDIIIDPEEIKGDQRQPTSSDLLLLLQLAKTGLRDMHPVFALCLQVWPIPYGAYIRLLKYDKNSGIKDGTFGR